MSAANIRKTEQNIVNVFTISVRQKNYTCLCEQIKSNFQFFSKQIDYGNELNMYVIGQSYVILMNLINELIIAEWQL